MSEARSLTNVIGNGVATLVVAKWSGELDVAKLNRELKNLPFEGVPRLEPAP
jgi:aerobic C4-dicarboxylate transport protein